MLQAATPSHLSDYELDVLRLLAEGIRPSSISRAVRRSSSSVYQALSRLRSKLHAENNQELILVARKRGYLPAFIDKH
jgi:DNA-binding CsgD family transcriptional regulator